MGKGVRKKKSKVKEKTIASPAYTHYLEHVYGGRKAKWTLDKERVME